MSSKFFQQKIISTTVISNNGSISDHPDHNNIKNMQWYKNIAVNMVVLYYLIH